MEIEFDPQKNERNIAERGISFTLAAEFDLTSAAVQRSDRYGEERFLATGMIGDRVHIVVFTQRGDKMRVISLRRANAREVKRYEEAKAKSIQD